jgi:hypothetical protein
MGFYGRREDETLGVLRAIHENLKRQIEKSKEHP